VQLGRTKSRQHGELEGIHSVRTFDHDVTPSQARALVRALAGAAEGSEKQETSVYAGSARPSSVSHAKRACAADGILEQLERDGIADDEIVERGALGDVAPMKEHLAIVCQADEPVTLADEQLRDSARGHDSVCIGGTLGGVSSGGRRLPDGAMKPFAQVLPTRLGSAAMRLAAAVTAALRLRTGLVDGETSPAELKGIQLVDGLLSFLVGAHLNECKTARAAGRLVAHDIYRLDRSGASEQLVELGLSDFVRQVSHIQLPTHDRTPLSQSRRSRPSGSMSGGCRLVAG